MATIDFVLDYFNTSMTLTNSAEILQTAIPGITTDATAIFDVSTSAFSEVFRFWTDASDVTDTSVDDVKYYVKINKWPSGLVLNPAHAMMESNAIAGGFSDDRSLVKHDYLRYLSQQLFNTHLGVDLFTNEQEMKDNIRDVGQEQGWGRNGDQTYTTPESATSIWRTLETAAAGEDGVDYYTNATTDNTNVTRVLLGQLSNSVQGRERLSNLQLSGDNDGTYKMPFINGDTISMKLAINAAPNQHALTKDINDPSIPERTYRIKLVLGGGTTNITPTD